MPPRKKQVAQGSVQAVPASDSALPEQCRSNANSILHNLDRVDILPNDPVLPTRESVLLAILAGAELHTVPDIHSQRHRIKRCIELTDLVIKVIGETNE